MIKIRQFKHHRKAAISLPLVLSVIFAVSAFAQEPTSLATALQEVSQAKKVFGPYHDNVVKSLRALADIYESQSQYKKAEAVFKRIVAVRTLSIGTNLTVKDYENIALALRDLAKFYKRWKKYAKTEKVLIRAMRMEEKVYADDYTARTDELVDMITACEAQGKYKITEPYYKKLLAVIDKSGSPDNLDAAKALNGLARIYTSQKRYMDAEPLLKRAVEINAKSVYINNLAAVYSNERKYTEAEALLKRSLEIDEAALGKDSPEIITDLNNLATVYSYQGKYSDAEPLYKRSLEMSEAALGPNHADVAKSLNNLATTYTYQKRYLEAEPLLQRAVQINEKSAYLNNLAAVYSYQGKYQEAEPLLVKALEIDRKSLGGENADIANDMNNLAVLYSRMGRYSEAEGLLHSALAIDEKVFGADNLEIAVDLKNIINLYDSQNKGYEAGVFCERLLNLYKINKGNEKEIQLLEERLKRTP